MKSDIYDYGFGTVWQDTHVIYRSGYYTSVADFHQHNFFEINLILSGNVKILLSDRCEEGQENRIVITRPGTPHYISCKPDTLYRRLYLVFTNEFVADYIPEWHRLSALFGEKGNIISLSSEQTKFFKSLIEQIHKETRSFRKRLLIYYLLSHLLDIDGERSQSINKIPSYVVEILAYIERNYSKNIVAADLSREMHIGRTTLMTGFKKYTGNTVGEYLTHCRLKNALRLLKEGKTLEYTAGKCGFSDSSGLIRSFKRYYGMTPKQYLSKNNEESIL